MQILLYNSFNLSNLQLKLKTYRAQVAFALRGIQEVK